MKTIATPIGELVLTMTSMRITLFIPISQLDIKQEVLLTNMKEALIQTNPAGPGSKVSTSYGPEDAITFELGYKGKAMDGNLTFAINYFKTSYDGKQFTGNIPVDTVLVNEFDIDLGRTVEVEQVAYVWGTQKLW